MVLLRSPAALNRQRRRDVRKFISLAEKALADPRTQPEAIARLKPMTQFWRNMLAEEQKP